MYDAECPYCGKEVEINHDDGYGYEENKTYEQECCHCGKTFAYTTAVSFYHELYEAPCMNGGEHKWKQMHGAPTGYFENLQRCEYCDEKSKINPDLEYDFDTNTQMSKNHLPKSAINSLPTSVLE